MSYPDHISQLKNFRNEGWVYYEKMSELNPGAEAKGDLAYSPIMTMSTTNHPDTTTSAIHEDDDDVGVAHMDTAGSLTMIGAGAAGSSTLFSSPRKKRKNTNEDASLLSASQTGYSAPPSSSAPSQGSVAKKRRSTKAESQPVDVNGIRVQQLLNGYTDMQSSLREVSRQINTDPAADAQAEACEIVRSSESPFNMDEQVILFDAFADDPRQVTSFLGAGRLTALQEHLGRSMIRKKKVSSEAVA